MHVSRSVSLHLRIAILIDKDILIPCDKIKKNKMFYGYRERQDIANRTRLVIKLIFRQNLLFIKLQIIEYED